MNADVLSTKVTEGIAVITLGSAKRMYFDAEMGDGLTQALDEFAGDPNIVEVYVRRLRNKLDDSGIPDQRADELANAILQDPNPKKFRRLLQARVVRNAGRFLPRTGR